MLPQQCVSINNSVSSPLPVVSGVPQGSILGPLLLLIFVNDLPDSISSSDLLLFANDAKCAHKIVGVSDCQLLQHDLDNIFSWCNLWNLHLNQDKCTLVRYTSYYLNDHKLSNKATHRDLGIMMSANLCWRGHYQCLLANAYNILGLLRRILSNVFVFGPKRFSACLL